MWLHLLILLVLQSGHFLTLQQPLSHLSNRNLLDPLNVSFYGATCGDESTSRSNKWDTGGTEPSFEMR